MRASCTSRRRMLRGRRSGSPPGPRRSRPMRRSPPSRGRSRLGASGWPPRRPPRLVRRGNAEERRREAEEQAEQRTQDARKQEPEVRRAAEKAVGKQEWSARRTELGEKSAALSAEREAA